MVDSYQEADLLEQQVAKALETCLCTVSANIDSDQLVKVKKPLDTSAAACEHLKELGITFSDAVLGDLAQAATPNKLRSALDGVIATEELDVLVLCANTETLLLDVDERVPNEILLAKARSSSGEAMHLAFDAFIEHVRSQQ